MRRCSHAMVWLSVAVWSLGCGGGDDQPPADDPVSTARPAAVADVRTVQKPAAAPAPAPPALALRLDPGQRFPLRKVVEQTLTQPAGTGPSVGRTRLELWLMMTVEDVAADGRTRLRAEYERVSYRHDVPDQRFEFDSAQPGAPVPLAAIPCRGLVGQGFSFQVGPDHQIAEILGFGEFLERCVRDVPAEHRRAALEQFARLVDTAEFANFVEDGIGLLPPAAHGGPAVGDTWSHERRLGRALPLHLASQCTLRDLNEHTAEIDIAGHVAPTAVIELVAGMNPAGGLRISVRGGHVTGHCTIDRATGLPLRSQIERHVEMLVEPAAGEPFVQHKHLVTTIEAFPEQPASRTALLRHAAADQIGPGPSKSAGAARR